MIIEIIRTLSLNKNLFSLTKLFNRLKLNLSYIFKLERSLGFPNYIVIELTNYCNLDCIMCPHKKQERRNGFMSFELYKKIINQIKDKAELVELGLYGEILLLPQFEKFIK